MQLSFTSPDCNYCWRNLQTLLSNLRECTKTEVYRMSTVPFFPPECLGALWTHNWFKGKTRFWDSFSPTSLNVSPVIIRMLFFFPLDKVNSSNIYDFMFYSSLGKHMSASQYVHNVGCVWISAGSIFEFSACLILFSVYEQSCTYLPWDETEFRWP